MVDFFHETQSNYSYIRICQVTVSEAAIFICGMQPRRRNPRKKLRSPKNNGPEQDNTFFVCVPSFSIFWVQYFAAAHLSKLQREKKNPPFPPFHKSKKKKVFMTIPPPPSKLSYSGIPSKVTQP